MERRGHEGSSSPCATAEGPGRGDTGLPAGYLGLEVVILGRIHFVFIQGIHAVERGGRGLSDGQGTGGVGTRGDIPVAFRACPESSPGQGAGVLVEAQVVGQVHGEVQHGVGPGRGQEAGE